MTAPVVDTTHGRVSGATNDGVHAFLGVPYGASTAGELRFRPPVPPEPWTGVLEATAFGPTAPQAPSIQSTVRVLGDEFTSTLPPMGEACLVLNVWTTGLDDGERPVMVWLHGGAFTGLSGSTASGAALAAGGEAVVVSVNHRLNALGYLHLDEIVPGRYEHSGVAGILDLVAALEWVRDNIVQFGGDPSRVTIFGCSGGGLKVSTLLAMPGASGLFHRAVIQSGPYLQAVRADTATDLAERILRELDISAATIEQLHDVPFERLIEAQQSALATSSAGTSGGWPLWTVGPVVGGSVLPAHPFEPSGSPVSSDVPLVIGVNKNEGITALVSMFASDDDVTVEDLERLAASRHGDRGSAIVELSLRTRPDTALIELGDAILATDSMWIDSVRIAERKGAAGPAPVYMYRFDYETDAGSGRARSCHALEVPFVFNDPLVPLTGKRPERVHLARVMSKAWVSFAADGDPNHDELPSWTPYTTSDRSRMIFDVESHVEADPTELREGLDALGLSWNPPVP